MSWQVSEARTAGEREKIYDLRYRILREPWGQPYDTAHDEREADSINAYISDVHGTAVACGRLQVNEASLGQIRYMAVDKAYQGKGLGAKILKYLEVRAQETNLGTIQLQARENAVQFYKAHGYSVVEKTFLLWGQVQHYLMQKVL